MFVFCDLSKDLVGLSLNYDMLSKVVRAWRSLLSPLHNHLKVGCLLSFGEYECKRWYSKSRFRELSESYEPTKDRFHVLKTVCMIGKVRDDTCAMRPSFHVSNWMNANYPSGIEKSKKLGIKLRLWIVNVNLQYSLVYKHGSHTQRAMQRIHILAVPLNWSH